MQQGEQGPRAVAWKLQDGKKLATRREMQCGSHGSSTLGGF